MSKVKIEINKDAVGKLLKSAEMEKIVKEKADAVAAKAGEGYESDSKVLDDKVVASAYTATFDAMREEREDNGNKLLNALGSLGGTYKDTRKK